MTIEDFKDRYKYDPEKDLLGSGGFAKVYKAYDAVMKRDVALKFYYGDLSEKYGVLAELKKVIRFNHPNLIRYYDATLLEAPNAYDSRAKVQVGVLEYANAGDFNDFMKTFPSLKQINKVAKGILYGLAHLHENGVVHRDIKPQNLLLSKRNGEWIAKIADFGLAKRIEHQSAASSQLLGTMEYMAPEQFDPRKYGINGKLSTNVDLWSFGVILYEMFTGEPAFGSRTEGISHEQLMLGIMQKDIYTGLDNIEQPYRFMIERCLEKNAAERVRSAQELIDILEGKDEVLHTPRSSGKSRGSGKGSNLLSKSQKRWLFLGNLLLSPILGVILYFAWKRKYVRKAGQALGIAWWSLAAWLALLLSVVLGMIAMEANLLNKLMELGG